MLLFNILLLVGIVICIVILYWLYRTSVVKNLDEFIEENYIVSDPGDEVEHIWYLKKEKNEQTRNK